MPQGHLRDNCQPGIEHAKLCSQTKCKIFIAVFLLKIQKRRCCILPCSMARTTNLRVFSAHIIYVQFMKSTRNSTTEIRLT